MDLIILLLGKKCKNLYIDGNGDLLGAVMATLYFGHIMIHEFNELCTQCGIGTDEKTFTALVIKVFECHSCENEEKRTVPNN